jgi:hypothetical protein
MLAAVAGVDWAALVGQPLSLTPALSRWERENLLRSLVPSGVKQRLGSPEWEKAAESCSLSQRERGGVRESGAH